MYYTYIIYSEYLDRYYTGHASNVDIRVERHNAGLTKSTRGGISWKLAYYEEFETRSEAMKREYEIKRWKSRKMIEDLIRSQR